jgi:OOP family OmpA-OmpF porin
MAPRCRRPRPLPLLSLRPLPSPRPLPRLLPAAGRHQGDLRCRCLLRLRQGCPEAEGKAKLDDLIGKIKGINLEVIIAVGHTDDIGTDAYNQKLSVKRAESVKAYLVSKGIEQNRVYTEGKGEKQPIASNKTAEGRAKNRRVEIEVVGTRANK